MKVLKNFSCNGVKKKVGEYLKDGEKEKIGEKFGQKLMKEDFLMADGEAEKKPESKPKSKK